MSRHPQCADQSGCRGEHALGGEACASAQGQAAGPSPQEVEPQGSLLQPRLPPATPGEALVRPLSEALT